MGIRFFEGVLRRLFLVLVLCPCMPARALSRAEINRIVASVAKPLPKKTVFYRWGSATSSNTLLNHKTYDAPLYRYFMNMTVDRTHFAAGRGVYISENPYSSARFIRGNDNGGIIEVHVEAGTPFVNLEDPATVSELSRRGVDVDDVYWKDPEVLVKYSEKEAWWVIKRQNGVSFKPFHGLSLKPQEVQFTQSFLASEGNYQALTLFRNGIQAGIVVTQAKDYPSLIVSAHLPNAAQSKFNELLNKHIAQKFPGTKKYAFTQFEKHILPSATNRQAAKVREFLTQYFFDSPNPLGKFQYTIDDLIRLKTQLGVEATANLNRLAVPLLQSDADVMKLLAPDIKRAPGLATTFFREHGATLKKAKWKRDRKLYLKLANQGFHSPEMVDLLLEGVRTPKDLAALGLDVSNDASLRANQKFFANNLPRILKLQNTSLTLGQYLKLKKNLKLPTDVLDQLNRQALSLVKGPKDLHDLLAADLPGPTLADTRVRAANSQSLIKEIPAKLRKQLSLDTTEAPYLLKLFSTLDEHGYSGQDELLKIALENRSGPADLKNLGLDLKNPASIRQNPWLSKHLPLFLSYQKKWKLGTPELQALVEGLPGDSLHQADLRAQLFSQITTKDEFTRLRTGNNGVDHTASLMEKYPDLFRTMVDKFPQTSAELKNFIESAPDGKVASTYMPRLLARAKTIADINSAVTSKRFGSLTVLLPRSALRNQLAKVSLTNSNDLSQWVKLGIEDENLKGVGKFSDLVEQRKEDILKIPFSSDELIQWSVHPQFRSIRKELFQKVLAPYKSRWEVQNLLHQYRLPQPLQNAAKAHAKTLPYNLRDSLNTAAHSCQSIYSFAKRHPIALGTAAAIGGTVYLVKKDDWATDRVFENFEDKGVRITVARGDDWPEQEPATQILNEVLKLYTEHPEVSWPTNLVVDNDDFVRIGREAGSIIVGTGASKEELEMFLKYQSAFPEGTSAKDIKMASDEQTPLHIAWGARYAVLDEVARLRREGYEVDAPKTVYSARHEFQNDPVYGVLVVRDSAPDSAEVRQGIRSYLMRFSRKKQ